VVWLAVSLAFRLYVTNFTDYNATYGTVGGVVVLLLWFYLAGLALLLGAEMNAEIEHSSPHGKAAGEKRPGERRTIGVAAARAWRQRQAAHPDPDQAPAEPSAAAHRIPVIEDTMMATLPDDRSLGQLVTELANEMSTLVRQEAQLAKTEIGEKVAQAKTGTALVAGGALLAYGGLLALVAAIVLALVAAGLPAWGAALIGAVIAAGGGYALVAGGALLAYGGLLALVAAIVLALVAAGLPAWGAALIGAVIAAGGGYALVRMGAAALKPGELVPRETIESLKEDVPWPKGTAN
jgi:hypothetical protein